jgi:hypothetical protein
MTVRCWRHSYIYYNGGSLGTLPAQRSPSVSPLYEDA